MNKPLHEAKDAKNDEYYTRLEDVTEELIHYTDKFKGKTVYCNCDDPKKSSFWRYLHTNFEKYGLKRLISTHFNIDGTPTYKMEYTGGNDWNIKDGKITHLMGDGDFRSKECMDIMKTADIIITNPPFSLFREYMNALMDNNKQFLIVSNMNAITYKEFFPLIKDNKVWLGYRSLNKDMYFDVPDDRKQWFLENKKEGSAYKIIDGNIMGRLASACWFTNLDHDKRHEQITFNKDYDETLYSKYDNYDAINVNKVSDIPKDYNGVMGVPITFLDKYNPEQFKIIKFRKGDDDKDLSVNGKCPYFRILVQRNDMQKEKDIPMIKEEIDR